MIDNTSLKSGRIKVNMCVLPEPDFSGLYKLQNELKYVTAGEASRRLGMYLLPSKYAEVNENLF